MIFWMSLDMEDNNKDIKIMQDKISQLVYRAEVFLNYSEKLVDLYTKSRKKKVDMTSPAIVSLKLHHILYFNEAVLVLASIFESKRNKSQEVSFSSYCDLLIKEKIPTEINDLCNFYWKSMIPKIRNKIIAHKQKDSIGDPCAGFINCYSSKVTEDVRNLFDKTKKYVNGNFDVAANNYLEDFYGPGFDFYFNYLKNTLNE